MEGLNSLFKNDHAGQQILSILFIIYIIMGYQMPEPIAGMIDTSIGKIIIVIIAISLFAYANPIVAVLGLYVAYDLISKSTMTTGTAALEKYMPSEEKKMSEFSAYNQFPYTLEQEVVKKMAPVVQSGLSVSQASYKPLLNDTHDATPIH